MVDASPWHFAPPGNVTVGRDWRAGMEQPSGSGPGPFGSGHMCRAPGPYRERRTPRPEVPMSAAEQPLTPASTAFRSALDVIRAVEPRVADAIGQEVADQREMLKLIA